MSRNSVDKPSAGQDPHPILESGKYGFFVRSALAAALTMVCAKSANAEKMPMTIIFGSVNKAPVGQVEPNESEIPASIQDKLSELKQSKGIDWDKLQEDLNLVNPVFDELTSKPGSPSLFKIGDELIVDEHLNAESKKRLTELMDKYKVNNLEQVKTLLAKKKLTSEDCAFLKSGVIEIAKAQGKIVLLSKRAQERLRRMSASAVKNAEATKLSSGDLIFFEECCDKLDRTIKDYEDLLKELDEFEQDLK